MFSGGSYSSETLVENGLNSQSPSVSNNVVLGVVVVLFCFCVSFFFFFFFFLFYTMIYFFFLLFAHFFFVVNSLFHFEIFWEVFIKLIKLIAKFLTEPKLFP